MGTMEIGETAVVDGDGENDNGEGTTVEIAVLFYTVEAGETGETVVPAEIAKLSQ